MHEEEHQGEVRKCEDYLEYEEVVRAKEAYAAGRGAPPVRPNGDDGDAAMEGKDGECKGKEQHCFDGDQLHEEESHGEEAQQSSQMDHGDYRCDNSAEQVRQPQPEMPPIGSRVKVWFDKGSGGDAGYYSGRVKEHKGDGDAAIVWDEGCQEEWLIKLVGRNRQKWLLLEGVVEEGGGGQEESNSGKRKRQPCSPSRLTYRHAQGQEAVESKPNRMLKGLETDLQYPSDVQEKRRREGRDFIASLLPRCSRRKPQSPDAQEPINDPCIEPEIEEPSSQVAKHPSPTKNQPKRRNEAERLLPFASDKQRGGTIGDYYAAPTSKVCMCVYVCND